MKALKKDTLLLTLGIILLFLLNACVAPISSKSSVASNASKPSPSPSSSASSKSPADILHQSATAMEQLQSVHFTISSSAISTTTRSSSSTPEVLTATGNVNGDVILPDQTALESTISFQGDNQGSKVNEALTQREVVKGGQVYMQKAKGTWYELSAEAAKSIHPWPAVEYMNMLGTVLPLVEDTNFTDHRTEKLNGQNLRHITVPLRDNAYKTLAVQLGMENPQFRQGDFKTTKVENAALDVWIDEATSYVHHTTLKAHTLMDNTTNDRKETIDYSQFNQIASIPAPADATPTTDLGVLDR